MKITSNKDMSKKHIQAASGRGTNPVLTVPASQCDALGLDDYPNFSSSGSVSGMRKKYYGDDALLIKCGGYIYNVSSNPDLYWAVYNGEISASTKTRKRRVMAAESYGWEVPDDRAQEAYDFAIESGWWDEASLNADIVRAISSDELAACLAFIFRNNDFQPWDDYLNGVESEDEDEDFEDIDYFPDENE